MDKMAEILLQISVLVFSVVVHEVAHGFAANKLGDPTAKDEGRLTLNPIPHIDPFMSVILPLMLIFTGSPFVIGGAKPVPVNPMYFRDHKKGMMITSLAGPASNILLAVIFAVILKMTSVIPVLGSQGLVMFLSYGILLNVMLAAFNLIPIPPLDGSKVLMGVMPDRMMYSYMKLEPYGMFIIIALLAFGVLNMILGPIYYTIMKLIQIIL
ncbi:MAG: Peptidase family M50 [Candidatus Aerophobetes bacterium ADurb.Bin490]|nr:MAG: Peptidase family M50 [Candidatus Aerophobetes bacterium ADurb.Bin490]HNZ30394.1 site-2 protease family protein [Candidatus Goldiibacteriota bacterium]HPI02943.1 site-2 protease family protein [Candidatus Goldiibacteriota bacterium]HPN65090.1 site-2 protease family protein [Candidatus Goldiibacteriota bacterium]HRQ43087.1 site-2 protease family protein [Candidatus Goldiibacteriota bacterium]